MSKELTKVIEKLKDYSAEVHTQLAYAINGYKRKPKGDLHLCCRETDLLIDYIQELKKQLKEKQNPLKGIFAQVNDDTLLRDCGNMNAEINELKNQQKEFISYLEKKEKEFDILGDSKNAGACKGILRKYKEIIGGKE